MIAISKITLKNVQFVSKLPKCVYSTTSNALNTIENTKFKALYKLPQISYISIINRLKLYQTVLTGITIPGSFALTQLNHISFDYFQLVCIAGFCGCFTLYGFGYVSAKFIGFIYYDEENDIVKVAYSDFWGSRKDIEIPTKDIVPLNELPYSSTDRLFLKFSRFSTEDTLKLNLEKGVILDKELFQKIFKYK